MNNLEQLFIDNGFKEKGHALSVESIRLFVDQTEKNELYFVKEISSIDSSINDIKVDINKFLLEYYTFTGYDKEIIYNTNLIIYLLTDNQELFYKFAFWEKDPYNARKIVIRQDYFEEDKNLLPFVKFNIDTENLELTIEQDIKEKLLNSNVTKEDTSYWFDRLTSEDYTSNEILEKI